MTTIPPTDDAIARQFNAAAYQLFEKIGEGGFGHVYRAKQVNTGQIVAIKFIKISNEFDEIKKQRYIERFERETLLCSRLQHPNIVRLLDKGRCGDELIYAVFEYVDGITLKQRLSDSGGLLPVEAAEIMAQVLDALSHAHEQGVIHRDIKPANIMLTKTGAKTHAKVLDFGIGTLVSEARQLDYKSITLTQETLGTPSYSAPEQLRGEPPTPKTDLYVWGLVFIECLTGQPAISGSSLAAVFHKQLSQSNVPLPAAIAGHSVADFLRKVLNKKTHERAADAAGLYNEFTQFNFSTLVGEIAIQEPRPQIHNDTTQAFVDNDATQVNVVQSNFTLLTERKQISVLSVALDMKAVVDDTDIDYEVVDAIHRDQKAQCVDIAIRFGAYHVGTVGDTLLFYFGYPSVSDNDSRLCARTALEIVSKLHNRNSLLKQTQGVEVLAHMGMHTGMMTTYADATPEGETTNVAMGLARMAVANQVLTTQANKSLLDTYLEFLPQQSASIGISSQPMALYSLVAERQVEAFGFLRANKNNYDFVGRQTELQTLQQLLAGSHATKANGQIAHIFGEAGIGKSRLVFELRNLARGFTHFVAQCLPEHKNNALFPILNVIKYKYSLEALSPDDKVQKLRDELNKLESVDVQDATPILCSWLALPLPADLTVTAHSPDIQKRILFDSLIGLLVNEDSDTEYYPHLFLFEDMHWADPTSIEFISSLCVNARFTQSKDVFVSTSRKPLPSVLSPVYGQAIELLKFNDEKTQQFVVNLFEKQKVAKRLLDIVINRTDGIPLFIEELVDMLKQKKLVRHLNGMYDFISPDKIDQVPATLRDSLQQKLDTLVYAKETAQLAAAIGREFDYSLLSAASYRNEAQLQTDLNELVQAELIYLQRKIDGDCYLFKHALVRDATYESMGRSNKANYHLHIADAMALKVNDAGFAEYDLLSFHYFNAGNHESSVKFGIEHASFLSRSSPSKETEQYILSIGSRNQKIENELLSLTNELTINKLLVPVMMTDQGYGSEQIKDILARNDKVTQRLTQLGQVQEEDEITKHTNLWNQAQMLHMRTDRDGAYDIAKTLVENARNDKCTRRLVDGLSLLGLCLTTDGNLDEAEVAFKESVETYQLDEHREICQVNGTDPKSHALINWSLALGLKGQFSQAQQLIDDGLNHAQYLQHGLSEALCRSYQMYLLALKNDKKEVLNQENIQLDYFEKNPEYSFLLSYSQAIIDWAKGETTFQSDFSALRVESEQTYLHSFYNALLAMTYKDNGDLQKAQTLFNSTLRWCETSGERAFIEFINANNK